ncbi:glutamate-1-semialdehyde 2,1-aminomutase [Solidesulfovibrio sp.]|uniref:glutamate-1-semialdehyde 2,1-aminomutase n=1 Tax=Solidesulfovibrio sp. TaxID=2910990 RepID=UPI000EDDA44B|nr:glutamate-1-semialdehyde 2,1-aminomutase [Solidesulfovibrio sp.]MEA5090561.1 glutamate-1-semialdehyde 2,1-aminomutase [Solidesulfovibrio sp.]HCR12530.1 glutamate-1-semialdehyde-2,1-aminomutase [Desulfovibrio sp.]HML60471.1 glutamate-1-semialdehyde 2,1-aminomutase [Solidesulfovibrio sp.]
MTDSATLFAKAQQLIPGGVNSPVRACRSVGCDPLFIASANGSKMTTVEGREMIDYVMSWGPMLLGHNHPEVNAAIHAAADKGASFGAPCPDEVALAQAVVDAVPGIDMVRMVNSGTEATMSAVRLARGFTGKSMVVKCIGGYHGHADAFLAAAGSGLATFCIPGTPGVPEDTVRHTLLAPYNDLAAFKELFRTRPDIACVIVEPVAGNMGLVPPAPGFLEGLRELTAKHDALLIFDEVITGFRLAYGGAQSVFGIDPDLTCLGKIIGGGLPVGAYGGKRRIMERIAPCGDVYQAGTLSGNPLAMAAGLATLRALEKADYDGLAARTKALAEEMAAILREKGAPVYLTHIASLFTLFFCQGPVTDFESAKAGDAALYASFYNQMREAGIILAPSAYECAFTSFAHSEDDYARTLDAVRAVKF